MDRIGLVRNNDTGGTGKLNKTNRTENFRMIQVVYVQDSHIICYVFLLDEFYLFSSQRSMANMRLSFYMLRQFLIFPYTL